MAEMKFSFAKSLTHKIKKERKGEKNRDPVVISRRCGAQKLRMTDRRDNNGPNLIMWSGKTESVADNLENGSRGKRERKLALKRTSRSRVFRTHYDFLAWKKTLNRFCQRGLNDRNDHDEKREQQMCDFVLTVFVIMCECVITYLNPIKINLFFRS